MNKLKILIASFLLTASIAVTGSADENKDTYIPPEYVQYCEEIGGKYSLSPEVLEAMIETESSGNPKAYNAGCCGLLQVDAGIHRDRMKRLGVTDIYDPYGNILVAADFLVESFEKYGDDFGKILMIYNGTSGAKDRAARNDFTDYANRIMERAYELETLHGKHDY